MIATAKGHYNGAQIVLDSPVEFQRGQEVIITYTVIHSTPKKSNQNALIDSLIGAIPNTGKSLEDYRSERLKNMQVLIDTNVVFLNNEIVAFYSFLANFYREYKKFL